MMNDNANLVKIKDRSRLKRRLAVGALIVMAAIGVGYGAFLLIPALISDYQMKAGMQKTLNEAPQIQTDWNKEFGPIEKFVDRFPKQMKNESAKQMEALYAKLVFDKAMPEALPHADSQAGNQPANVEFGGAYSSVKEAEAGAPKSDKSRLEEYTKTEMISSQDAISEPPKELIFFFTNNSATISSSQRLLMDQPPPGWEVDLKLGDEAPIPNLLMHMVLQRIFVTGALMAANGGHDHEAADYLEAGWKLNQGLRNRPDLVSQLIYLASARYQIGVLRKMHVLPAVWGERLNSLDTRDAINLSMAAEVYAMSLFDKKIKSGTADIPEHRIWGIQLPTLPTSKSEDRFLDATLLDMQRITVRQAQRWKSLDACRQNSLSFSDQPEDRPAEWNIIGAIVVPNLGSSWRRANRLRLEAEATQKLLQIRATRASSADHLWPAAIPGIETTICKDQHWIYEISPDRKTMKLHYSIMLDWPGLKGPKLPMSFTETAP
jgi:hypothetical protein